MDLATLISAFFPRVPLAVPYWNWESYRSILHCVISGCVIDGRQSATLRSQIVEMLGVDDALLCGSGSLALELALRACRLRAGDEVIIPSFCCSAVVPPILATGATPVLADVGDELNLTVETVEAALTQRTRAIVVAHLFGNPADIDAIAELARGRNILVIDDAAQALGATIHDQTVGSFGAVGILSFGAEKVCFGLGGGALVSSNGKMLGPARQFSLSDPSTLTALEKLLTTLFWRRWRKWTLPLQHFMSRAQDKNPDTVAVPDQNNQRMANLNAAVALSLVHSLSENLKARRARVQAYRGLLGSLAGVELIRHRPGSACLNQVVRVLPKRRGDDVASRIIDALGQAGYEVQGSYVPIHLLGQFRQCVWDSLPYAERVWADLVELPCEPSVSFDDVDEIARLVTRCVND